MKIKRILFVIIASIMAAAMAASLCACVNAGIGGGNGSKSDKDKGKNSQESKGTEVVINGKKLTLDYETNHGALHYCEDIPDMTRNTLGSVREIVCTDDEGNVCFVIRLVYFRNKGIGEVMEGSDNELSQKTMNGLGYSYFEYEDPQMPDGEAHSYLYFFEGTTYMINFVSEYDMNSLEEGFFKTVFFKAEE
ncbi:MAG: hypothetical protein ILO53_01030 [Clostridia bacterium]|nr:hypothetical protein [Clostridia bacterium]